MLVDIYVEALLVDEVLADQVWELWDTKAILDEEAAFLHAFADNLVGN